MAEVGTQLTVELDGTDATGARLAYTYRAADLTDLSGNAQITVSPSGAGEFEWTPLAADVGSHAFDFTASDGTNATTVTININVKSAIGSATAPVFRQPLGTGTTFDVTTTPCVDLVVVIDDQASAMVTIAQEQPLIDGATLTTIDGLTAKWHWCPSAAQQSTNRYTLVLSANDMTNPKTIKDYLIVLTSDGTTCPGAGPAISHTPADQTTRLDLALTATVTDAIGLKDSPLLYYSTTDPGAAPNLSQMTQLSATQSGGTTMNGQWTASVPNPVAAAADGTTATLYYIFVADDTDTTDNCNHTTQSPTYQMVVTAGGSDTAGLCNACTDDSQCGAGNECVYMGTMGDSYCVQACGSGCPSGYSCSADPIESIDFASALQCVPQSGSCVAPAGVCQDDSWTPNQTMSEASANPVLQPGIYDTLVSCPDPNSTTRADDDWYKIVVATPSEVDLYLTGDGATDLDLHLYDSSGDTVDSSTSDTADEQTSDCLDAKTYYIKVNGYGYARSEYTLEYDSTPMECD